MDSGVTEFKKQEYTEYLRKLDEELHRMEDMNLIIALCRMAEAMYTDKIPEVVFLHLGIWTKAHQFLSDFLVAQRGTSIFRHKI